VFCFAILLLLEGNAGELNGKTLVSWRKPLASPQGRSGLVPALKMGEREAVVVIEVSGVTRSVLQKLDKLRPALLVKELLRLGRRGALRGRWQPAICREQEQQSAKALSRDCLPQGLKPRININPLRPE